MLNVSGGQVWDCGKGKPRWQGTLILPNVAALGATQLKGSNVTKNFTHHPLILVQVQVSILLLSTITVTMLRIIRPSGSSPTFVRHFAANYVKLCRNSQTFSGLLATTRSPGSPHPINTPTVRRCTMTPCLRGLHQAAADTRHSPHWASYTKLRFPGCAGPGRGGLTAPIVRCYGLLGNNARSSWRNRSA